MILIVIAGIYDRKKSDKKATEEAEKKRVKMEKELERFKQKEEEEKKLKQLKQKIKKMKDDGYNVDEPEEKIKSYK